ncbi:hypothetical protein BSZ31_04090 [Limnobacter sp. SAORIC-690]|uniref:hypothetical protein n=1 Tax=Limnobacter sp. SAORIC-690 TaxID=1923970 RepID=UPI000CF4F83C|nr:hypothetical protein [Limnobacter sp. SAORIC-690]PQJ24270.1 hypothetical protein BSZ31_04090 [Limnobacter sp. SAORIC-690]
MNAITESVDFSEECHDDHKSLIRSFQRSFEEKKGQNLTFFEKRLLVGFVVQTDSAHCNPTVNPHLFVKNKAMAACRTFIDGLERFAKAHQIPCAFSIASSWVGVYAVVYISTDDIVFDQLKEANYTDALAVGCQIFEEAAYQEFMNSSLNLRTLGQSPVAKFKGPLHECFNGYFSKSFDLGLHGVAVFDEEQFLDYSGFSRNQSTQDCLTQSLNITDLMWQGSGVFKARICSEFVTHGKKVVFNFNPIFDFAIRQLAGSTVSLKLNFEHSESIDTHLLKLLIAPEKEKILLATKSKIDNLSRAIADEIL